MLGQVIGNHRLVHQLGEGGMGAVTRVFDEARAATAIAVRIGRHVANIFLVRDAEVAAGERAKIAAQMCAKPAPASVHAPWLPRAIDALALTCLAKSAGDRYQSMHELGGRARGDGDGRRAVDGRAVVDDDRRWSRCGGGDGATPAPTRCHGGGGSGDRGGGRGRRCGGVAARRGGGRGGAAPIDAPPIVDAREAGEADEPVDAGRRRTPRTPARSTTTETNEPPRPAATCRLDEYGVPLERC